MTLYVLGLGPGPASTKNKVENLTPNQPLNLFGRKLMGKYFWLATCDGMFMAGTFVARIYLARIFFAEIIFVERLLAGIFLSI